VVEFNLEEREEGFKCDASIGASLAVCGLHQLLHVPLRRVLAQRAKHVPDLGHLDQAVPLRVKELEDLLEVLHLVLGEPLGLLGHPGEVVGAVVGRWVRVLGHGRKSGLVRHWDRATHRPTRRPTATATAFLCAPALKRSGWGL